MNTIKQMAADMETVSDFLGMKGRFESDTVRIGISDLANIIRENEHLRERSKIDAAFIETLEHLLKRLKV